jgi:ABC-type lipoprotein release transport system permease subunit
MERMDPAILGWAAAALALAAFVAVLAPAFRAASADPAAVLREG